MAKGFLLSERDAGELQKMLRWWKKRVDVRYQRRRRHGGGRGGTVLHNAYAKAAAGAGTTIVCFLDTDATGDAITVTISIAGGSNLNYALPRLEYGTLLTVWKDGDTWRNAGNPFQASGPC